MYKRQECYNAYAGGSGIPIFIVVVVANSKSVCFQTMDCHGFDSLDVYKRQVKELHIFLYEDSAYTASDTVKQNSEKIVSDTGFKSGDGH